MESGPPIPWQIVGVYRDVRNLGPRGEDFPEIDVPFAQSPWPQATIAVRASVEPALLPPSSVFDALNPGRASGPSCNLAPRFVIHNRPA